MSESVLRRATRIKTSLGSSKEARNAFDQSNETCWTIELQSPSTSAQVNLTCTLDASIPVKSLKYLACTFAGGFAPIRIVTTAGFAQPDRPKEVDWLEIQTAYPADGNLQQQFPYEASYLTSQLEHNNLDHNALCTHLAFRLEGSTDGFGRIVVYKLDVVTD